MIGREQPAKDHMCYTPETKRVFPRNAPPLLPCRQNISTNWCRRALIIKNSYFVLEQLPEQNYNMFYPEAR